MLSIVKGETTNAYMIKSPIFIYSSVMAYYAKES